MRRANDVRVCGSALVRAEAGPAWGGRYPRGLLPAPRLPGRERLEYDGALVKVRVDTVVQPDGSWAERDVVEHVGSVAIVAIDDQQRVLLIRQYRHPAGHYLRELPAGPVR